MTAEIESIGLKLDTAGVERGIKSLEQLAAKGPVVERAMAGIEGAAAQAGKGISALGQSNAKGLDEVAKASGRAAQGMGQMGQSAQSAVSSQAALAQAVASFTQSEKQYVQSLLSEYNQLSMNKGERAAYIAQSKGMSQAAQEVAGAVGKKIDAYKQEQAALEQNARAHQDASASAMAFARSAAVAVAGGALFREYMQAADAITTLNNQLKQATGSTAAAEKAYVGLYEVAQRARVSFTDLGTTYASISRATGEMGISQQRMLKVTESIANAMTISGGSASSMQAALVQLSQGFASGVLRGEELNSVMEQTPRLARAIADGMGVSTGKLREMGAAGQLTADTVVKALESQSAVLAKEVSGAVLTVGQAFTQLSNSGTKAVGEFDKASGASTSLAQVISSVATAMDGMGTAFQNNETIIKTVMGSLAGAAALATLSAIPRAIASIGTAVTGLGVVLAANPIVLTLLGVGAVIGGGIAAVNAYKKTEDGIKASIRALEAENARAEKSLAFTAGMGGSYQLGDDATRVKIDERTKAIKALNAELALMSSAGLDTRTEDERNASRSQALKQEVKDIEALAAARRNLYGVKDDYQTRLKGLADLYDNGNGKMPLEEYQAAVAKLAGENYKAEKSTIAKNQAIKDSAESYAAERAAAAEWAKMLKQASHGIEEAEGKTLGLNKAQEALVHYLESPAYAMHTEEMRQMGLSKLYAWDAAIKHAEAVAAENKVVEEWAKSRAKEGADIDARNQALREEIATIGLSKNAVAELARAKLEQAAAEEEAYAAALKNAALLKDNNYSQAYEQAAQDALDNAAKLREQATLEQTKGAKQAAEEAKSEWQKTADDINKSITDALMRGFESGKGFARNLRDTIVNMFKTLVLRPIIQFIVQPLAGGIMGVVQGGMNAMGLGGGSNLLGLAGNASSAYSIYSGGLGATAAGQAYAGYTGATLAPGMVGPSATAVTGASQAGGMLASIPGWGWAALGGLALLGSGVFNSRGANHSGGVYSTQEGSDRASAAAGLGLTGNALGDFTERGSKAIDDQLGKAVGALSGVYQSLAKYAGDSAKQIDIVAGFAVNGKYKDEDSYGYFKLLDKLTGEELANYSKRDGGLGSDPAKAWEQYIADMGGALVGELRKADIPKWMDDILAGLGDKITVDGLDAASQQIGKIGGTFTVLGQRIAMLGDISGDTQTALLNLSGGIDALASATDTYYQNFYSDAERRDVLKKQVEGKLSEVGITMPNIDDKDARQQFRDIVESLDLTTESGQKAWATLMGVSGAFAELTPAAQSAQDAISKVVSAQQGIADALSKTGESIGQLMRDAIDSSGSAEEASRKASQAFEQQFYDNAFTSLTDSIGSMIQGSVIAPMMDGLLAGATASSAALAAGGVSAASAMAAGGVAGASASAAGGAIAGGTMSAGGSAAASAMVSGGAAVGQMVSAAIEGARAQISSFRTILTDPEVQQGIKDISGLIGEATGDLYDARTGFMNAGLTPQGNFVSAPGDNTGSDPAMAMGNMTRSLDDLIKTLDDGIKTLTGDVDDVEKWSFKQSQQFLQDALAAAQAGGGLPDTEAVKNAIADVNKGIKDTIYASAAEESFAKLSNAGILAQIRDIAQGGGQAINAPASSPATPYAPPGVGYNSSYSQPYIPPAAVQADTRTAQLIEALTQEVQRLQTLVREGNAHNQRTADAVNGKTDGMPMLVEVVTP